MVLRWASTRRGVISGGLGMALLGPAHAQAPFPEILAPKALLEDLSVIERAWKALHPGLYRYQTPTAFEGRMGRLQRWAIRPQTHAEFLRRISALAAAVKCGHTFVNPANQGKLVRERYLQRPDHVPFAFRWIDTRMVVTDTVADSALQRGDVVERIGGVDTGRLLEELIPLARADGGNDAKRRALMEVRPGARYPEFDLLRNLLHPHEGPLALKLRRGKAAMAVAIETVTPAAQAALASSGADTPTFTMADGVGVMRFSTWALYNSTFDWRGFIDASVDAAIGENARGLILDNRGNEGGLDVGNPLLERLIAAPIALPAERRRVRYRQVPDDLNAYLDTWDDTFRNWGDRAVGPAEDGWFDLAEEAPGAAMLSPRGRRFPGRFAVLADAANSSATFRFAQIVRENRLGPIVGAATGGNQRGINGGAYFFLRLPNSRIEVDLPLIGYFPVGPERPDAGLEPDIFAPWTLESVQSGEDPALAVARAHILSVS